ncbi:hypothetical protein [Neisseria canis]|uniref:Uncharacterized protein n=1 Tax=Neisseria canis TaxID=493 RepID=A0A1X3CWN0_9NEIS|nr:hypothetical protein [Neisseria canis]OSI12040.1 hypothetical protein BWD07_07430 [Neisseria canis]VEF03194.1 Uncharacterised protein [Neisseria canis]
MEIILSFFKSIFFFWNRKNLKKYFQGEFEPTEEELVKIQSFFKYLDESAHLREQDSKKQYFYDLNRQLEQKKIPYFKELSVEELDFLMERKIGLDGILDVVFAKGGMVRGLGAIKWNADDKKYDKKKFFAETYPSFEDEKIKHGYWRRKRQKLRFDNPEIIGFLMMVSILICLSVPYIFSFGIDYTLHGIQLLPIWCCVICFLCFPFMMIPDNISEVFKRLNQEKYAVIFQSISDDGSDNESKKTAV